MGKVGSAKLTGAPIRITTHADLRCQAGRIVKRGGTPVHAATYIRRRHIVLDADLLRSNIELRRILIHELFHFVWVRLANPVRHSYEQLLRSQRKAPGELGWSAEYRKCELTGEDIRRRSRRWREYCCEAFCDTAAYVYARSRQHDEFTLPQRHCQKRIDWFGKNLGRGNVRM